MCMAKQLKPIDGHIAQINAPRFAGEWGLINSVSQLPFKSIGFLFFKCIGKLSAG